METEPLTYESMQLFGNKWIMPSTYTARAGNMRDAALWPWRILAA